MSKPSFQDWFKFYCIAAALIEVENICLDQGDHRKLFRVTSN